MYKTWVFFLFRDIKLFKYRFDWFISIFECYKDFVEIVIELRIIYYWDWLFFDRFYLWNVPEFLMGDGICVYFIYWNRISIQTNQDLQVCWLNFEWLLLQFRSLYICKRFKGWTKFRECESFVTWCDRERSWNRRALGSWSRELDRLKMRLLWDVEVWSIIG